MSQQTAIYLKTNGDWQPERMNGPRLLLWLVALVGIGLSLFQLYSAGIQPLGLFYQRGIHLALVLVPVSYTHLTLPTTPYV